MERELLVKERGWIRAHLARCSLRVESGRITAQKSE